MLPEQQQQQQQQTSAPQKRRRNGAGQDKAGEVFASFPIACFLLLPPCPHHLHTNKPKRLDSSSSFSPPRPLTTPPPSRCCCCCCCSRPWPPWAATPRACRTAPGGRTGGEGSGWWSVGFVGEWGCGLAPSSFCSSAVSYTCLHRRRVHTVALAGRLGAVWWFM